MKFFIRHFNIVALAITEVLKNWHRTDVDDGGSGSGGGASFSAFTGNNERAVSSSSSCG
jgi:hypothetical protein